MATVIATIKINQSAAFRTEERNPLATAGTKTIAKNEIQTIPRANRLRGLSPLRSRISGTRRKGTTTAAMVAAMTMMVWTRSATPSSMAHGGKKITVRRTHL